MYLSTNLICGRINKFHTNSLKICNCTITSGPGALCLFTCGWTWNAVPFLTLQWSVSLAGARMPWAALTTKWSLSKRLMHRNCTAPVTPQNTLKNSGTEASLTSSSCSTIAHAEIFVGGLSTKWYENCSLYVPGDIIKELRHHKGE